MLNRMLSMIYILMNKGTVTAGELAKRFEVSTRTIYRDVEALSMAGIPVYARKGKNGGIGLTEQFVLDRMLISREEQGQILAALASLQETGAQHEEETLRKLGDFFRAEPENWVAIDFSDWSGRRKELFEELRQAILEKRVLKFDYYNQQGEMTSREVEPMQLLFKEYTWYIRAFCRTKEAMRLFKVLRMKRLEVTGETFVPDKSRFQEPEIEKLSKEPELELPEIIVWIDRKEAYRVYDRFDEEELTVLPEGDFLIHMKTFPDDWIYGVILSFGPSAKVLAPAYVKAEISRRIREMLNFYDKGECS